MRRILALAPLVLLATTGAFILLPMTPAQATTPTRTIFFNVGSFVDTEPCGFPILTSFNERFTDIITFDSAGIPLIDNFHLVGVVTASNPANGVALDIREVVQSRFYPQGQNGLFVAVHGVNGKARVDGGGVITINVGRLVFDLDGNVTFEAGIHFDQDVGVGANKGDFCTALAGG
jgi:hypothetical protein